MIEPSKKKRFRLKLLAACNALAKADADSTDADFAGNGVNLHLVHEIAKAESLILAARELLGLPRPALRRPLPEPSMN